MEYGAMVVVHWTKTTEIAMKLTVGTKEDLVGLMDDWDPSVGRAFDLAKQKFPNSYSAIDSAIDEIKLTKLPGHPDLYFTITIFVHFSRFSPGPPKTEAVRKVKRGYTGAVHIYRNDLFSDGRELPTDDIRSTILERLRQQVALLLNRKDMKH